ncbi:death-associated inhibitor of apoptosis 1-like [Coccinella septempunctata]|uniref:death-associated inhibitor of apoptosis 1-like n=1 Tax=Coccinella septempunctata TaxID=41139 RepID=UPI001D06055D|nr:death-associated inhibitor of apoptosis 1-like [Coccinella septempunctata]
MPGLSIICNRCIPGINSNLPSSETDDSAYVQSMTPRSKHTTRRSSPSTGQTYADRHRSAGFWRSWEFVYSYPELNVKKSETLINKLSKGKKNIRKWRTFSRNEGHANPETKSSSDAKETCPEVLSRSRSLDEEHVNSGRKELPSNEEGQRSDIISESSDSNEHLVLPPIITHDDIACIESNFTSHIERSNDENYFSMAGSSKGAIPKYKNVSQIRIQDFNSENSIDEVGHINPTETASSSTDVGDSSNRKNWKHSFSREGKNKNTVLHSEGKIKDKENMTSLLQFNNHSLGKDVLDNGISILNTKLQVHTTKDRLKTFKNWPNKRIDPKKLAEAGFFYCGRADIVECFKCGIKGHNWVENDKPMEDHTRWNKDCPFVRENTTEHDNIRVRQGQDICGNLGVEILPNSRPEDVTESETSLEKLGIQKTKGPSHPDQIIYDTRLATFENWPKSMKQKPPELANAGFYYLGVGDQTLCFFCGGGLKDWDEDDDPWEQHALWFPKCNFLLLKKTPAFVEAVQRKHKGLLSIKKDETEIEASCSSNSDTKESSSKLSSNTEERKSEESSTLCKICFKNELGVVFLPCGHMVACIDCASALKECAVCRKNIQATVRAFLS